MLFMSATFSRRNPRNCVGFNNTVVPSEKQTQPLVWAGVNAYGLDKVWRIKDRLN